MQSKDGPRKDRSTRNGAVAAMIFAAAALGLLSTQSSGCAGTECNFASQCEPQHYCSAGFCRQDCQRDFDCDPGLACSVIGQCVVPGPDAGLPDASVGDARMPPRDTGLPPVDAFVPPMDSRVPPIDAFVPPIDAFVPPVDTGTPPSAGRYLDRCTTDAQCMSNRCVDDIGGTRMCTQTCVSDASCASEHVCGSGGVCLYDDTGEICTTGAAALCATGLCVGNPMAATGACTRQCNSAADCPAGFACSDAGGTFVCVETEKPCSDGTQCGTGLCLSVQGCTSPCRTAADCPQRFAGLPAYTCAIAFGSATPICVPPADIIGNRAIGTPDPCPPAGVNLCRSGICDSTAPTGAMCTQACTVAGGCGPNYGCFPLVDVTSVTLVCSRAGFGALGSPCPTDFGRLCDSGLCDLPSLRCTRFCADGLCPSDATCTPLPLSGGAPVCRFPPI